MSGVHSKSKIQVLILDRYINLAHSAPLLEHTPNVFVHGRVAWPCFHVRGMAFLATSLDKSSLQYCAYTVYTVILSKHLNPGEPIQNC